MVRALVKPAPTTTVSEPVPLPVTVVIPEACARAPKVKLVKASLVSD